MQNKNPTYPKNIEEIKDIFFNLFRNKSCIKFEEDYTGVCRAYT